jgi:transcriptional regulator with XRE-family HTH domain
VARYAANNELRLARAAAGLSQDAFAGRLGEFMRVQLACNVSPSGNLIGMWERGECRPGQVYRRGLTAFTGLDEAALGFGPQFPPALAARTVREEADDTDWRDMLSGLAATGLALSGFRLAAPGDVPHRVGPQHVTEMYRTMTYSRGADAELQRAVARLMDRATTLLGQVSSPRLRNDLLDAAADAAGLAAYACRDLGQHQWAQQYYLIAMQAAQSAGDRALAGHRTGPDWQVRHVAEAELYSLTGAGYTELARHQPRYAPEAIHRLNRALDLRGADVARNATLDTISLAEAHLADHDLSQAVSVTRDAIRLAETSASRRIRKRLRELGQQLTERQDPRTAAALEQITRLTTPATRNA